MAYSLVSHIEHSSGANGGTSSSINTTGANFVVINVAWYNGATADVAISDSNGNTWTPLTKVVNGAYSNRLFYCASPAVGSGHTFTVAGTSTYPSMQVQAFSGSVAVPHDQESTNTASGTSVSAGSITPSENGCILITGMVGPDLSTSVTIDNGFTAYVSPGTTNVTGGMAYKIQTTAAAVNPAWSVDVSGLLATSMSSFKSDGAAGGTANPNYYQQQMQLMSGRT